MANYWDEDYLDDVRENEARERLRKFNKYKIPLYFALAPFFFLLWVVLWKLATALVQLAQAGGAWSFLAAGLMVLLWRHWRQKALARQARLDEWRARDEREEAEAARLTVEELKARERSGAITLHEALRLRELRNRLKEQRIKQWEAVEGPVGKQD